MTTGDERGGASALRLPLRVGLTGGLASGKTTVAAILRELGAFHVDADAIARELLARGGGAYEAVVARFGRGILDDRGAIDRKALAGLVFADVDAREALNALVHPRVREEIERRIEAHARGRSPAPVAIVDAALLVEAGFHAALDALVVTACPPEVQAARAVARGGMTEGEARARIAAQAPLEAKLAAADYVIDTGGTLEETRRRTQEVWRALLARARKG